MNLLFDQVEKFALENSKRITVSCSVGIARLRGAKMFKELYQDADEALYRSKNGGKNCFAFYDAFREI